MAAVYAVWKKGASAPPENSQEVDWQCIPDDAEVEPYKVVIDSIPDGLDRPMWDVHAQRPRARNEAEMLDRRKEEKLEAVATQAAASLSSMFVNSNEVIGLLASCLNQLKDSGISFGEDEDTALQALSVAFANGMSKKTAIEDATESELEEISW